MSNFMEILTFLMFILKGTLVDKKIGKKFVVCIFKEVIANNGQHIDHALNVLLIILFLSRLLMNE